MLSPKQRKLCAAAQPPNDPTLKISVPVTILHAAGKPGEDGQPAGPGSFEAVAYTGGLLPGYTANLDQDVVIDLAGMSKSRGMKANLQHDEQKRVGHLTEVVNDGRQVTVKGLLSAATPYRDEVRLSAADGYPWEISVEHTLTRIVPLHAGKQIVVNGQTITGPAYIARKSTMTGVGFASHGADRGNQVKIVAAATQKGNVMEFDTWLTQNGFDPEAITEPQRITLRASFERTQPSGTGADASFGTDDPLGLGARRLEAKRIDEIKLVAHRAFDDSPHDAERIESLARQAVSEHWTANELELRILRASRQPAQPRFGSRERLEGRVLEAALLQSAGYPNLEKEYDEQTLDGIDRAGLRNVGIGQVLLMAACHNGYPGRVGERLTPGNTESVLQYALPPATAQLRASGFSTASLGNILSNVANKELTAGHAETDQEWREVSRIVSVNNYFAHDIATLHGRTEYEDVTPTGELKHGSLSGTKYSAQAKTTGKIWTLSHEDIVNDDVGFFDRLRQITGRGAGEKLNRDFWTRWLAGIAAGFWSTAKGNKVEHANSTLLADGVGLEMLKAAFYKLRTPAADGKNRVSGPPVLLVVPQELSTVAERFYASLNLVGGSSTVPDSNIHHGKYKPVIVPQLSDANYSGYSATHWWMLRSPQIAPPMVVAAIGGRVEPTVESAAADFNRLGVSLRGWQTANPSLADDLCGMMSKGAA